MRQIINKQFIFIYDLLLVKISCDMVSIIEWEFGHLDDPLIDWFWNRISWCWNWFVNWESWLAILIYFVINNLGFFAQAIISALSFVIIDMIIIDHDPEPRLLIQEYAFEITDTNKCHNTIRVPASWYCYWHDFASSSFEIIISHQTASWVLSHQWSSVLAFRRLNLIICQTPRSLLNGRYLALDIIDVK